MDSRAIRKPGIRQRHAGIDHTVASGYDLLNHIFQPFSGYKAFFPASQLTIFLYIDSVISIDHNFIYPGHLKKFLHNIQTAHGCIQL